VAETGKPLWVSLTLEDGHRAELATTPRLRSGEMVEDAAVWAAGSGAEALLFNCSRPEVMAPAIKTDLPVVRERGSPLKTGAYANAFETSPEEGGANETLHALRPDFTGDAYLAFARRWAEAGATLIGGCCGVGADHMRRLADLLS
jgi:S-methylmethionine-dependent homocysteine/selenocysteine methylase